MSGSVKSEQVLGNRSCISVIAFLPLVSLPLCFLRFNLQHVFDVRLSPDSSSRYPPRPPRSPKTPRDPPRPTETTRDPLRPPETHRDPPRPPETPRYRESWRCLCIIGGRCHKYHFCRDRKRILSRQKYVCRDKHNFVATKSVLSRQK